jgi:hypothetical protein
VVRVMEPSTSTVGAAFEQATAAAQRLEQKDLAASFQSLLAKVQIVVTLGNEIVKVRSRLHYAKPAVLIFVIDPSLCKPCLANTLRRITDKMLLSFVVFGTQMAEFLVSERTTRSRRADFGPYYDNGRHLLFCNTCRRPEDERGASSHRRTDLKTNDSVWFFY